ncbi:armadillo-type protein [Tribonema minus]|uniref:Armadillo-type protein n=1 Tax=Tribonema minus TaxID=303371 RepID=A0A835ZNP3_9STRA|nr:armadillo-type protein [Tribonema minus]
MQRTAQVARTAVRSARQRVAMELGVTRPSGALHRAANRFRTVSLARCHMGALVLAARTVNEATHFAAAAAAACPAGVEEDDGTERLLLHLRALHFSEEDDGMQVGARQLVAEAQLAGAMVLAECQLKLRQAGACDAVVGAMRRHASAAIVARCGLQVICCLAHENDANCSALGAAGACQAVVAAMRRHSSDAIVAQDGVQAIMCLAEDNDSNLAALTTAGACQTAAAVLRKFTTKVEVLDFAAVCISVLAQYPQVRADLLAAGAGEGLFKVLEANSEVKELIFVAVGTLVLLSSDSTMHRAQSCKTGAGKAMLRILCANGDDAEMQGFALSAILALADTEASMEVLSAAGACRAVIAAMNAHPTHELVQQNGLFLVSKLVYHSSANKARLLNAGVCEVLVSGLQSIWLQKPLITQVALLVIVMLSSNPSKRMKFAKFGNLGPAVVAAMGACREHAGVQSAGSNAIGFLARLRGAPEQLIRCNALAALANAVRAHPGNSEIWADATVALVLIRNAPASLWWRVQGWCSNLLRRAVVYGRGLLGRLLLRGAPHPGSVNIARWGLLAICHLLVKAQLADATAFAQCQRMFREAGACDAVVTAMQRHASDLLVARHGLQAIVYLAVDSAANNTALGTAGACQALTAAMRLHPSNNIVAFFGAQSIMLLWCGGDPNHAALGAAGACQAAAAAQRQFITDKTIRDSTAIAITILVDTSAANCAGSVAADVCGRLVEVLEASVQDKVLAGGAVAAIVSLSTACRVQLGEAGACKALLRVLCAHVDDAGIQNAALSAILDLKVTDSEAGVEVLGAAGACRAVTTALQTHLTNLFIQLAGLTLMASLNIHNSGNRDADVQSVGLNAIQLLASSDSARAQLRRCGALEALAEAVRAHSDNSEIRDRATYAAVTIHNDIARMILKIIQYCFRELLRRAVSCGRRLLQLNR